MPQSCLDPATGYRPANATSDQAELVPDDSACTIGDAGRVEPDVNAAVNGRLIMAVDACCLTVPAGPPRAAYPATPVVPIGTACPAASTYLAAPAVVKCLVTPAILVFSAAPAVPA